MVQPDNQMGIQSYTNGKTIAEMHADQMAMAQTIIPPSQREIDCRLQCLAEAVASAKAGVRFDVLAAAQQFYKFAIGQPVEDATVGMTFHDRIEAVIAEFLRDERLDGRAIKHAIAECLERLDNRWPTIVAPGGVQTDEPLPWEPAR